MDEDCHDNCDVLDIVLQQYLEDPNFGDLSNVEFNNSAASSAPDDNSLKYPALYAIMNTNQQIDENQNRRPVHSDGKKSGGKSGDICQIDRIPKWSMYFQDQKDKIAAFEDSKVPQRTENAHINDKISIFYHDITLLEVDAVVNSTTSNYEWFGGNGTAKRTVDRCIHAKAGPQLSSTCAKLPRCEVGQSHITPGCNMPCKYIIHTVAPHPMNLDLLKSCYASTLAIFKEKKLKSIAFPCIGTGEKKEHNPHFRSAAARVALSTVREFLEHEQDNDAFYELGLEEFQGNLKLLLSSKFAF